MKTKYKYVVVSNTNNMSGWFPETEEHIDYMFNIKLPYLDKCWECGHKKLSFHKKGLIPVSKTIIKYKYETN